MNELPSRDLLKKPADLRGLFAFYHDYVKALYSYVQTENALAQETLFEINAALDHISRIYTYDEPEASAVGKAFGHLKRSCLDIFKLYVKETRNQYNELNKMDTSSVDNGDFDGNYHRLFNKIKRAALDARRLEGQWDDNDAGTHVSFDRWQDVLGMCIEFRENFFYHQRVLWIRKHAPWLRAWKWASGIVTTMVIGWCSLYLWNTYISPLVLVGQ